MKYFLSLLRQLIFWLLFFATQRFIFVLYHSGILGSRDIGFLETLGLFYHAFQLDLSTASFILIFPFIIVLIQSLYRGRLFNKLNIIYTSIVILVYLFIVVGEIGLYGEWNTKLSYKALAYLQNPGEVFRTAKTTYLIVFALMIVIQWLFFTYLYRRYFYLPVEKSIKQNIINTLLLVTLVPALLILGIRGGFGEIPITSSKSYFSKHSFLNHASVNPAYNIVFSVIDYYQVESQNHFHFMPDIEAKTIVDQLHFTKKDTTIRILKQEKPNIVMIFLESWSGDLIESLGGVAGITPEFHQLEQEGLLFTSFYATGNRSQQAMASVFGGLPALPITTLSDHPQKYTAVPSLIKDLNETDYSSSFYFGGDLDYGNIRSYLIYNEFDKLVEQDGFDENLPTGKLGIHDEALFQKWLDDIGHHIEPFFTAALTLSSHSPYDYPGERPIDFIETQNQYVNSAHYTDKWLGWFMSQAKKKPWYKNTLFVILADHSHLSYNNYQIESFNYRRIPLLLTGGALCDSARNTKNEHLSTNTDLSATLLKQLDLPADDYYWSKNMLNPYSPQFAYFELNDGFGWKRSFGLLETNVVVPFDYFTDVPDNELKEFRKEGQAYLQILFKEFLEY